MELWFVYAAGASVFAALTTILAKIGLKKVDSGLAAAIRTVVIFVFAWLMVFIAGSQNEIVKVNGKTWVFLILSGFATGGSWLFYFRALQIGNVNRVVPVDKSSTILTMILAFIFLSEPMSWITAAGMVLMGAGTWLMLELRRKNGEESDEEKPGEKFIGGWLFYALLAAVFASLTAILGKIGIADIEANLGTAIRTMAVIPMSWLIVFISKSHKSITKIDRKSWLFLILSGVAAGTSWLLFYQALQLGNASHVVPVDKLSVLVTMVFARIFLKEKFSKRSITGLVLLTAGTLFPIIINN
jgi:transporter family protein